MTNLILPEVESNELDVPSLLTPGTRVAFTGRNNLLGGPADDDRLTEICEAVNLEYKKSVTKSRCDVLVAHDPASQSSKAQKAQAYDKPIISQEEFENWYYNGPFLRRKRRRHCRSTYGAIDSSVGSCGGSGDGGRRGIGKPCSGGHRARA